MHIYIHIQDARNLAHDARNLAHDACNLSQDARNLAQEPNPNNDIFIIYRQIFPIILLADFHKPLGIQTF